MNFIRLISLLRLAVAAFTLFFMYPHTEKAIGAFNRLIPSNAVSSVTALVPVQPENQYSWMYR